ncbi:MULTISPECIES: DUF4013 domain-containing protein [Halorubrum]|uniref:DUF4013 domain-containing protein n=1 Tax=Halorubrum sodomense TaxID=35743 RepID=A0A1I6FM14_HALSD|nr:MULTISPECIES: DUF4013 domain-containing protein [Halorubrum]TKX53308.1 DUF4013 domain-containing protein [Halorubrum sp. SP3]SFR30995.1 Protein of unknown function [Halorubrum sodomense]
MLTAAAAALARTDDAAGVVLVGGAVTLLAWVLTPLWLVGVLFVSPAVAVAAPVALAPSLVARGYFVRVTRLAVEAGNADGAPSLVAWGELVRDGAKSALLSAVLLAPLAGGLAVAGGGVAALVAGPVDPEATATTVESALGPNGPAAAAAVAGGGVAALVGAYLLAFAYVRPAALAAFAASGRLRDGLDPRTVAGVAATGPYATGWALAVGALAVGYAVAAPAAPLVVGVALAFAARVVAHGLYGRGAADALGGDATRGPAARPDPDERGVHSTVRSPESSPVPVVSGDGGRPIRSEPSAAVQVGRAVPIGDGSDGNGNDGTGAEKAAGANEPDETGFEWGSVLNDAEDKS